MLKVIKNGIKIYKKANNLSSTNESDYPKLLNNIFGITISLESLRKMSAIELLNIIIKKEI